MYEGDDVVAVATATTLRLNGFSLEPSTESFTAYHAPLPEGGDMRELRRSLEQDWVLYREDDVVLGVPLTQTPTPFGVEMEIECADHLGFLGYLINAALPRSIRDYEPFKQRPFTFLGKKQEIVARAAKSVGVADAVNSAG